MSAVLSDPVSNRRAATRIGRLSCLGLALAASAAGAQGPAAEGGVPGDTVPRTVSGRVVRPGPDGLLPVPRSWVTLHRVAPDSSGPLDSVRTDAAGRYVARYRPTADDAVYFASSMYGGIAYFTPPLPPADAGGDAAEITVFDTTSAPLPIRTRGRHLVVSASAVNGRRTLVEVFELSNDTIVTAVSGGRRRATWSTALAPNAADFQPAQSDIGGDAIALRDGRVLVYASLSPGIRQVAFSYSVPAADFPLSVPVADTVGVFEVLLEDPGATASGAGLAEQSPVNLEGRSFRRFLAQDMPAGATVTVDVGAPTAPPGNRLLLAPVLGAAAIMALALAFALTRRRPARVAVSAAAHVAPDGSPPPLPDASHLARDIAELDDAFARVASPTDAERETYRRRRDALKARLTEALAKEQVTV